MCGITGTFHYRQPDKPVDPSILDAMTDSLAHRGPDGRGTYRAPGIGLGHRRLAVIDLTDHAQQPMTDPDRRYAITYNGEIYNFKQLRTELETRGYVFNSSSDTEVILNGYRAWGADVVQKLNGIFAFAIWDGPRRSLFLARDPMGVKPLFVSDQAGTFRFGSEIKAILTDPSIDRALDDEAVDAFFTFSYTPAPLTGFENIRQLLPGHWAEVSEKGLRISRYWECPYTHESYSGTFDDAVTEFTERFDQTTQSQMVSDVPVGAFLSGGLDSAAIVRAMTRANTSPVSALTVGFSEKGFDEREAARQSAKALNVALEEQEVHLNAAGLLPEIARHAEEPIADSSMLPVYLLCQSARQRFTVAMSGDGADELLAGYDTYRASAMASHYRALPTSLRRLLIEPAVRRLPMSDKKYNLHQVANRFIHGAQLGPDRDHAAWRIIFNDRIKARLYAETYAQRSSGYDALARYTDIMNEVPQQRSSLSRLLHSDSAFYLPNDMLVKVDRMSMAHGLEVRVPFLDRDFVRFCATLPNDFKLHRGKTRKHILRESLRPSLPNAILQRRKSGFNIPLEQWMRHSLRDLLWDSVNTQRKTIQRYINLRALNDLVREHDERTADHAHALFAVLMFSLWIDNAANSWKTTPTTTPARIPQFAHAR